MSSIGVYVPRKQSLGHWLSIDLFANKYSIGYLNGDKRQNAVGARRYYLDDQWFLSRCCLRTTHRINLSRFSMANDVKIESNWSGTTSKINNYHSTLLRIHSSEYLAHNFRCIVSPARLVHTTSPMWFAICWRFHRRLCGHASIKRHLAGSQKLNQRSPVGLRRFEGQDVERSFERSSQREGGFRGTKEIVCVSASC